MSKKIFYLILASVSLLFVLILFFSSSLVDDIKDQSTWELMKKDLHSNGVESIYIVQNAGDEKLLSSALQKEVIDLLLKGKYKKSNRKGYGPTPEHGGFVVKLQGDIHIRFISWGSSFEVFEITQGNQQYEPNSQFLIENEELINWFEKAKADPNQRNLNTLEQTENQHLALQDIQVTVSEDDEGFTLLLDESSSPQSYAPYVSQTIFPPNLEDGSMLHVIRYMDSKQDHTLYRKDALLINPKTKDFQIFPLTNTNVLNQEYTVDSIVQVYGYVDEHHILYIAAHGAEDGNSITFNIETLDVLDGSKEVLFPSFWAISKENHDFISQGFMTENNTELILNSFHGLLWTFNLQEKKMRMLDQPFPSSWPISLVYLSPDGKRLWHEEPYRDLRLFSLQGKLLKTIPLSKGSIQYPSVLWSPDSKYALYQYTFEQNNENILSGEEMYVYATQGVRILGTNGDVLQQFEVEPDSLWRVEFVHWLGDKILLHYFQVHREGEEYPKKINSIYKIGNIQTGKVEDLREVNQIEDLSKPILIAEHVALTRVNLLLDEHSKQYFPLSNDMQLIPSSNDHIYLLSSDNEKNEYSLYLYASQQNILRFILDVQHSYDLFSFQDGWLIAPNPFDQLIRYTRINRND